MKRKGKRRSPGAKPGDTPGEMTPALRPIASLIRKSEKARRKLAPGTWQRTMLRGNLKALRLASDLMSEGPEAARRVTQAEFGEMLAALGSMIHKTRTAKAKFPPGTPTHTLQRNRLQSLRLAERLVKAAKPRNRRRPTTCRRRTRPG